MKKKTSYLLKAFFLTVSISLSWQNMIFAEDLFQNDPVLQDMPDDFMEMKTDVLNESFF